MINLLSNQQKSELSAAKRNIILRRITIVIALLVMLVAAIFFIGYYILDEQSKTYRADVERLKHQQQAYADVIKQATDYSNNLKTAKTIFQSEFTFSNLLIIIARTLPPNTVMADFSVSTADMAKPVSLNFLVKSPIDGDNVKLALQRTPYFKDTKIRVIEYAPENITYLYRCVIITNIDHVALQKAQREGKL